MFFILHETTLEHSVDLPEHYGSLSVAGGILITEDALLRKESKSKDETSNEFLEGVFNSQQIGSFMAQDNTNILNSIQKLLSQLNTKTKKIKQLIEGFEKKKMLGIKKKHIEGLKSKFPHLVSDLLK